MTPQKSTRGSALVVALIFAAIIAISLTSYIQLSVNSFKLAQRSFYANAAINLVDTGLEQVLWSLNHSDWTGAGFTQVSGTTTQWQATFPSSTDYFTFHQGAKGQVKVWVDQGAASLPHVVAQATVTLGDGTTLTKQAEVYMHRSSYFNNGLVAKNSITFSGNNASVDSWNSDPDDNPATAAIPYSSSVAHDKGSVGSTSVQTDAIGINNSDIYGYAAVGSSSLSGISVGPNGLVGPYGTPNGTIDTTHVTYDFTTSFPDVTVPSTNGYTIAAITADTSLPRAGDSPAADGYYYYSVPSISLSGNNATLSITGSNSKVMIVVTNTTGTTVSVTGHGGIDIATGSSLALYTSGSVSVAGNGISNGTYDASQAISSSNTPNQPASFQLYGTLTALQAPPYQSISVAGNGILSGVIYAPNASISLNGGGSNGRVLGAMVGNTVSVTGNSTFHFDESLANLHTSKLWGLSKWRELVSASDRNTYASDLSF
jgi:hypothetical protein